MKRHIALIFFAVLFLTNCRPSVLAKSQPDSSPIVKVSAATDSKDDAKEKELKEKEAKDKQRKEDEAKEAQRKENEKKEQEALKQVEERKAEEAKAAEVKEKQRKEEEAKEAQRKENEKKEQEALKQAEERRAEEAKAADAKDKLRKEEEAKDAQRRENERREQEAAKQAEEAKAADAKDKLRKEEEAKDAQRKENERKELEARLEVGVRNVQQASQADGKDAAGTSNGSKPTSPDGKDAATKPNVEDGKDAGHSQHGSTNEQKEYDARRQSDKRRYEEGYNSGGIGDVVGTVVRDTVGSAASDHERQGRRPSVSLLYAPGGSDGRKGAFGVQWLGSRGFGVSAWFSGDLDRGDDVIDASIPHTDYYTESMSGSYGVQGLYSIGSESCALILGLGVAVDQTLYTDVSNATGWKWNGGRETKTRGAGQVGLKLRLAERISLQFGYDSAQYSYFGLSGSY